MRKFFIALGFLACFAPVATTSAQAGGKNDCTTEACQVLNSGHARGRIPVACFQIPFIKEGRGEVAMFVVQDFDPHGTPEEIQWQLDPKNTKNVLFSDSKITGPIDDFCRNPKFFAGARWVVLCDEHHKGWITGESLQNAIRNGHLPPNRRIHIGTHV